jgi:hypothetical protein
MTTTMAMAQRDTTMTAKTMAADDEDNEVDGDGAMGDGTTGDYGDNDDYGDGQWTTTTMATARRATK